MQLRELDDEFDQLSVSGVALHAIAAEPGGDAAIKTRLEERDTPVRYPVHSDPEHKLLLSEQGTAPGKGHSLYVKKTCTASNYGGSYQDYTMVQPAFVVVNNSGEIQQTWSWNTEPLASVEPQEEMVPVASFSGASLVSVRPVSLDIGPSILESRPVRLQGNGMWTIMKEMPNTENWTELKGSLIRAVTSMAAVIRSKLV